MFCTNCGKEIPDDSAFCEHCGAQAGSTLSSTIEAKQTLPSNAYAAPEPNSPPKSASFETENAAMQAVIGANSAYYLGDFAQIEQTGKGACNWASFFLGLWHAAYRNMWRAWVKALWPPILCEVLACMVLLAGVGMMSHRNPHRNSGDSRHCHLELCLAGALCASV